MKIHEEIFCEESIDTLSRERLDALELPLSQRTFALVFIAVALTGAVVIGRIAFLGFRKGDFYTARAEANVGKEVLAPAARGIIYDRFHVPLLENIPTFSVSVKVKDALAVAKLLELPEEDIKTQLRQ